MGAVDPRWVTHPIPLLDPCPPSSVRGDVWSRPHVASCPQRAAPLLVGVMRAVPALRVGRSGCPCGV